MDGIADIGGMQGWGPVKRPGDEPVFGEQWEARAFALGLLSMRTSGTNLDSFRHALERQSPMNYIADGYFGRGTEAAVRAFKQTQGLPADGIASVNTQARLAQMVAGH